VYICIQCFFLKLSFVHYIAHQLALWQKWHFVTHSPVDFFWKLRPNLRIVTNIVPENDQSENCWSKFILWLIHHKLWPTDIRLENFLTEIVTDLKFQTDFLKGNFNRKILMTELWRTKFGRKNLTTKFLTDVSVTKGVNYGLKIQSLLFVTELGRKFGHNGLPKKMSKTIAHSK